MDKSNRHAARPSGLRRAASTAAVAAALTAAGCADRVKEPQYHVYDGFALGTTFHIIASLPDTAGWRGAVDRLFEETSASMSVYDPGSLLNRLNRNETDSVDRYIADCIAVARIASEASGGVYDITIKPITEAWGFTGHDPQQKPRIDSLLQYVGYEKIRVEDGRLVKADPGIQIELNSVAKGYIVDLLGGLMEEFGSADYIVEVGGEVVCRGRNRQGRDWVIGIDTPQEGNMIPGHNRHSTLSFTDRGFATSGNYRKFYTDAEGNRVVHTVNALTGESRPSNLLSASVLAPTCALADAYGTMFMALGLEASAAYLEGHPDILGYLIYDDGQGGYAVWHSPGMEHMIGE